MEGASHADELVERATQLGYGGLAITDRIVVALGGRIGVESTAGEGSEFHVVLPALVTDALPAIPALPMG